MVRAVIVAAGSSRRMGFDKIFAPLYSKPVLYWSIAAFQKCPDVADIILVTREDTIPGVRKLAADEEFTKLQTFVPGGSERHLSVWAGLKAVRSDECEFVAIHDGARPLVTPKLISDCIALARRKGAASCAAQIPDTVKRASYELIVTDSVERSGLWAMQTPQVFSAALILQAYASLMTHNELVTDEVSAIQKLGKRVSLLQNDDYNFKITFPRDLAMAEQVLEMRATNGEGASLPETK